jgi:hypothetical protein
MGAWLMHAATIHVLGSVTPRLVIRAGKCIAVLVALSASGEVIGAGDAASRPTASHPRPARSAWRRPEGPAPPTGLCAGTGRRRAGSPPSA